MVSIGEMQFGFIPETGTIDTVSMLRRMQEECYAIGRKFYMCFVDLVKAVDRKPRKVLAWAMRKKKIP